MTSWTQPIGEARTDRAARRSLEATQQARQLVAVARGTDAPISAPRTRASAGGDSRSLRGIPAIGRGVAGAIAGTAPHGRG